MPYKSDAQRRFFNANRSKLEKKGVDVDEWNAASVGLDLPKKKSEGDAVSDSVGLKGHKKANHRGA